MSYVSPAVKDNRSNLVNLSSSCSSMLVITTAASQPMLQPVSVEAQLWLLLLLLRLGLLLGLPVLPPTTGLLLPLLEKFPLALYRSPECANTVVFSMPSAQGALVVLHVPPPWVLTILDWNPLDGTPIQVVGLLLGVRLLQMASLEGKVIARPSTWGYECDI